LPEYTLAIWHGVNLPLVMSVIALIGGAAGYFALQRFVNLHSIARTPLPVLSGRGGGAPRLTGFSIGFLRWQVR
jgi:hypothetical protein